MLEPVRIDIDPLPEASPAWWIDEAMVKRHCRVDFADDDALLQAYLSQAIIWAENSTHRTIIRREHRWVLRRFPEGRDLSIWLPRGKTVSVDSIRYFTGAADGIDLTGPSSGSPAGTDYQEDLGGDDGGILMPPRGRTWPSVSDDVPAPVTITFEAGYPAGEIPGPLLHAILLGTGDGYDLRGSGDMAALSLSDVGKTLASRMSLLSDWVMSRWY